MLHVEMPLSAAEKGRKSTFTYFTPIASADIDFKKDLKKVHITLKGVIQGTSTKNFLRFMQDVSSFRGNKWILKMNDLEVLSTRGINILVKLICYLYIKETL